MQSEFIIALLSGLGGMLCWGLADFFAKKTIDEIGDMASLAWGHIFGTLALFLAVAHNIFFFERKIVMPSDAYTWIILILFGVLQAAVYFFLYRGFGKGQVSLLSPIFASFAGITAIISIVFFGESVNMFLIFALIIIFCGNLLVNIDPQIFKTKRFAFTKIAGFKEIALATLLAALWTLLWGKFVNNQDWLLYALFMYGFMTLAILVLAKLQKINLSISISKSGIWKFLVFIGLFEVVAYLAVSFGYSATSRISVIAILSGAFSLPLIILARIFLKEKVLLIQRIGSVIIILGIMLLALSK